MEIVLHSKAKVVVRMVSDLGFLTPTAPWKRTGHSRSLKSSLRCAKAARTPAKCISADANGDAPEGGPPRYMPKVAPNDPIVSAVASLPGAMGGQVTAMELLDSRWNGNEALRVDRADGLPPLFAKINRVEDPSVFMSEAVGLTALLNAEANVHAPKPLHIGKLPRVGDYGPGAFMLLEWYDLVPFGAQRPGVQRALAQMLAGMHRGGEVAERVHQGRFGFPANNFLALTPMDNTWMESWPAFFAKRLTGQIEAAYKDKAYGRAPLSEADDGALRSSVADIIREIGGFFEDVEVTPSLLHGDLWIGNVGATKENVPVIFDPACFYGHSEFDLAIMRMYGGFTDEFWNTYFDEIPKQPGFELRAKLYELYNYLNQLNLFGDPAVKKTVEELATGILSEGALLRRAGK